MIQRSFQLNGPITGFTIKKYKSTVPSLEDKVLFDGQFCYFPDKVTCDVADDTGHLKITNHCPADTCTIIYEMLGKYYCIDDGEGGCWNIYLNTGDSVELGIIANFSCEEWPESQIILLTFIAGYVVTPTEMTPTDYLGFDVFIYHPETDWMTIAIIGGVVVGVGIMAFTLLKKPRPIVIGGRS